MNEFDMHNSSLNFFNGTPWFVYECTLNLDKDYQRIALFLLYLLLFMVGLAENTLVVWVNWRRRHSANGVLFCVINVSLSDLMVVLMLPFYMLEVTMDKVWLWGRFLCKVTHLIYVINFYSSSFFLAFMTLERYLSLSRPSSPACFPVARRRRWLLCGGLWLLSLFLALLENVHMDLLEWDEPGCYMLPENNYTEWFVSVSFLCLIFQFLGPASIIITCNILIARAVRSAPDVQGKRDVWLVHVYSLVFVLCWLPYHIVLFLMMVDDLDPHVFSCNTVEVLYNSYSVVEGLSLFHCIANPVLYNFLSKSFRSNLINAVVHYAPREGPGGSNPLETAPNAGGPDTRKKERKLSNMSTSHSDVAGL
ncbi:G-protein coupled receptor 182 isoform X1 [Salmo salar]|uniref:G-protein coupled receptor 182 n=1 Tax=Salmo salar TaxID=8030 RepID=B5X4U7_SALSA|nr:G-protein coupled receptor 182 [Salmo salar]XP_014002363.1 G-protein coupled receptor 182 isoform X1 [Salmo salar]ACI34328.1 G-protein coupled receptor 182 [Salmo salar]|eukprot:NP_001134022.1 G-protein coupled receptor 182 [Salmo salar]